MRKKILSCEFILHAFHSTDNQRIRFVIDDAQPEDSMGGGRGIAARQSQRQQERLTEARVRRYLTFMKTTISSKGQIVLPAEFR